MKCNFAIALLLAISLTACTTSAVTIGREMPTEVTSGEAIAFVFSPQFSLDARRVEESEIIGCISDVVRKAHPKLRIVPPEEFRRTVFPDLAPEAAPNTPEYFALILNHPTFKERVSTLSIRYLISVVGGMEQTGGVDVGGVSGPGGGVLVIAGSWDRKSSLTASVLDLRQGHKAGKLEAVATGTPWLLIVFPSPIMIGAATFTESKACGDLGEAVAQFIAGEDTPAAEETQR